MQTTLSTHNCEENNGAFREATEVRWLLRSLRFGFGPKCGRQLRGILSEQLLEMGWSKRARVDSDTRLTVSSMKENTALCMQFGNMSRMYADLLKLEVLYRRGRIKRAVFVVMRKSVADASNQNTANFERLSSELTLYEGIITLPLVIVGVSK